MLSTSVKKYKIKIEIFLEAQPLDDMKTYLIVVLAGAAVVNVSNQSVLVRTVSDNWYVCLLSSLCCRS